MTATTSRGWRLPAADDWRDRRVVVVGAGRSGVAAARLLRWLGARVVLTDRQPAHELPYLDRLSRQTTGTGASTSGAARDDGGPEIELACGGHPDELWADAEVVVVSPGVPDDAPPLRAAREAGLPLVAEVELAARFAAGLLVGVTGSNGKSTVTAMAGEVLAAAGRRVAVCGNIGRAFSDAVLEMLSGDADHDTWVVELSSFQTGAIQSLHPGIAVLLNLTPDHLDRHGSMEAYARAKTRLLINCTGDDWMVVNADDPLLGKHLPETPARRAVFSRRRPRHGPAAWVEDGRIWWLPGQGNAPGPEDTPGEGGVPRDGDVPHGTDGVPHGIGGGPHGAVATGEPANAVVGLDELRVLGPHNAVNAAAAAAVGALAGAPLAAIADGLRRFRPLEHRMESCGTVKGIRCINDSKATNVDATTAALQGFDAGVWLILGGRDKGSDFSRLRSPVGSRVERLLLIGEATGRIADALAGTAPMERCETMERAVMRGVTDASPGDVLLLSPACTSFDQFDDFEARGRRFKALVAAQRENTEDEERSVGERG